MTRLKPYPALKESGVPWLGLVPEHWQIERLKSYVRNVIEQATRREDGDLYVALEHVEGWTGRLRPAGSEVSFDSQVKRFRTGDVLFEKLRPYLAKVTRPTSAGVCVGEFIVLRPRSLQATAPYVEQFLRSKPVVDAINSSTFGAKMPRADWQFIGGMTIALPALAEQGAIVRFLDYVDRRIRRYIGAKQRLISLLEEQKQAIIHRAVTRGLDPDVRLKPTGVEWLGDVPEHWEVRRAKHLFREADQRSEHGTEELLSVSHLTGVTPRSAKNVTMFRASSYIGHKLCVPGDLVINTMWAWMGALGVAGQNGIVSPSYGVYRPIPGSPLLPGYIDLLLRTKPYVATFGARSTGIQASRLRLYPDEFLRMPIISPPLSEQTAIVMALAADTSQATRVILSTQQEIELIRQYRTRLVADVVTGKLDVREAAARLPDEAEEPEPLAEVAALIDLEDGVSDNLDAVSEEPET